MKKLWGVLFGVMAFLSVALFVVAPIAGWWMPKNVNVVGGQIDFLFYAILALTGVLFIAVQAVLVYALIKYIAKPGRKVPYTHGILSLEIGWTAATALILVILAFWQIGVWAEVKYPASMAQKMTKASFEKNNVHIVHVQARQWEWRMRYPSPERVEKWKSNPELSKRFFAEPDLHDIRTVNELHIWKDADVIVQFNTQDVIHSFFLPNLRVKQDALPGKTVPVWFKAIESNTAKKGDIWVDGYDPKTKKFNQPQQVWELACAEFCGSRHSNMRGKVYVHESFADYSEWLETMKTLNMQRELPKDE